MLVALLSNRYIIAVTITINATNAIPIAALDEYGN